MAVRRKHLFTLLKLLISAALIYFIFTKIEFRSVADTLKNVKPFYLFLAVILFVVSKILAAFRLNGYFHQLQLFVTQKSNLKLYLLGMFYNLFLPGGIGGDAYKGYVIKKKFDIKTKKVVSVLLLDRLSGLLLLFVYACLLALLLKSPELDGFKWLIGCTAILSIIVFWWLNRTFFKDTMPFFWQSAGYSSLVQLAQLVSVFCVLKALSISVYTIGYLFIFLISSIVAVVPLTIGGFGSRELTFFYGAELLGLDEGSSVSISVVFFIITAFVSLFGLLYHLKKPALEVYRE